MGIKRGNQDLALNKKAVKLSENKMSELRSEVSSSNDDADSTNSGGGGSSEGDKPESGNESDEEFNVTSTNGPQDGWNNTGLVDSAAPCTYLRPSKLSTSSSFLRPSRLEPTPATVATTTTTAVEEKFDVAVGGASTLHAFVPLSKEDGKEPAAPSAENQNLTPFTFGEKLEERADVKEVQSSVVQVEPSRKRKLEDEDVSTGEEDEVNIFQAPCKLFIFDGGNWLERGRGTLRLNDSNDGASRLIFRTLASLRLMLNMKIWNGMTVSKASEKSVRFSGVNSCNGTLGVFLVTFPSSLDTDQLALSLEKRILNLSELKKRKSE